MEGWVREGNLAAAVGRSRQGFLPAFLRYLLVDGLAAGHHRQDFLVGVDNGFHQGGAAGGDAGEGLVQGGDETGERRTGTRYLGLPGARENPIGGNVVALGGVQAAGKGGGGGEVLGIGPAPVHAAEEAEETVGVEAFAIEFPDDPEPLGDEGLA